MIADLSQDAPITYFFGGSFAATFVISGLVFFKFWKRTRERFFLYFALSCWVITLERLGRIVFVGPDELANSLYFMRLPAYLFIVLAIADINRLKKGNGSVK